MKKLIIAVAVLGLAAPLFAQAPETKPTPAAAAAEPVKAEKKAAKKSAKKTAKKAAKPTKTEKAPKAPAAAETKAQ